RLQKKKHEALSPTRPATWQVSETLLSVLRAILRGGRPDQATHPTQRTANDPVIHQRPADTGSHNTDDETRRRFPALCTIWSGKCSKQGASDHGADPTRPFSAAA